MAVLESKYSNQVFATLQADVLAPGQVTGLAFTVEQGKVKLSWSAVTKNSDNSDITDLAGYRIYRKDSAGGSFALVGSVDHLTVDYTDSTIKDGASFIYAVSAIDAAPTPNEGAKSADLAVKTIPSVPTGLISSASETAITLNWASVKSGEDAKLNENLAGYNVYRSEEDGTGYVKVGNVAAEETTYADTSAVFGVTYYYVITSFDNSL